MEWQLVAVGEVLLDVTAPALAGSAVVHGPIRVRPGGVPVHAAVAAAAAGARAAVVGRVGADPAAAAIRDGLRRSGVGALLAEDAERPTGTFVESGAAIAADRGASAALEPADLPSPLDTASVLVSGHALLHDDTKAAARAALDLAGVPHAAVVAASALLIAQLGADAFHDRARGATVLIANADEARALTGRGPARAAAELAGRYALACVTDGPGGAYASSGGQVSHVPADPRPGSATGAGDALAGVLVCSLAQGLELEEALAAACDAARPIRDVPDAGPGGST
jgi:sugar/nucleoside kinase (ribokinase family)